jgi:hypothetical protein
MTALGREGPPRAGQRGPGYSRGCGAGAWLVVHAAVAGTDVARTVGQRRIRRDRAARAGSKREHAEAGQPEPG